MLLAGTREGDAADLKELRAAGAEEALDVILDGECDIDEAGGGIDLELLALNLGIIGQRHDHGARNGLQNRADVFGHARQVQL